MTAEILVERWPWESMYANSEYAEQRLLAESLVQFELSNGWTVSILMNGWGGIESWAWLTANRRTCRPRNPAIHRNVDGALAFLDAARTW